MNNFTTVLMNANAKGAAFGIDVIKAILLAESDTATNEEILLGYNRACRMLSDTKRSQTVITKLVAARDTAKLSFEVWFEIFKEANNTDGTGDATFDAALVDLRTEIDHAPLEQKIAYFWDYAMPSVGDLHLMLPGLKDYVVYLETTVASLAAKRKKAMSVST